MNCLFLAIMLLVPTVALPDNENENYFIDGVMHVNERQFLLGELHEYPMASWDISIHFMVRSSVLLRDYLDSDPVLMFQDFDIRRTIGWSGDQYFTHLLALEPDPRQNCQSCHFDLTFDPVLQVQNYETYFNGFRTLLFLPTDSEVVHGFRCELAIRAIQIGDLDICSVIVVYPYHGQIVLNGSRLDPGSVAEYGPGFAAIAKRMLDVVTCIDVTKTQDSERPTDLSQMIEDNPSLTGCEFDLLG